MLEEIHTCPLSPLLVSSPHTQLYQRDTVPRTLSPSAEQSAQVDPSYGHDGSKRLAASNQVDPQRGSGHSCVCVNGSVCDNERVCVCV